MVIRQTDKGGAFVVWRTDLYIAEASRQLADHRFYEKIPNDATQTSQQEVKSSIETAIRNNQLPPSATNLIVEHPHIPPNFTCYPRSTSLAIPVDL